MLDVKGLAFSYGTHEALADVTFSAGEGQLIAVLGSNGAGKSTMFRCLLGLLPKYEGEIRIAGRDIREMTRKEMAGYAAYIPQAETPVFNYTVFDTVLMGTTGQLSPMQKPGEEQIRTAEEALKILGITDLLDRGINEISGGERQLAYLARAMAQQTKLLVMDEPTANLDYGNQQMVLRHVRSLAEKGYTILMSTHNPEHALQYAGSVLVLKDRRVFAFGKTEDTLTEELIGQVYGMKVVIAEITVNGQRVRSCIPVPDGDGAPGVCVPESRMPDNGASERW